MNKMIKLTNTGLLAGDPIWINCNTIGCIFTAPSGEGGSIQTRVYGGPTGVEWIVEESPEEVIQKIAFAEGSKL